MTRLAFFDLDHLRLSVSWMTYFIDIMTTHCYFLDEQARPGTWYHSGPFPKKYKRSSLLTSQQIITQGALGRHNVSPHAIQQRFQMASFPGYSPMEKLLIPQNSTLRLQQKSIAPLTWSAVAPDANAALHSNPVPELQALMKKLMPNSTLIFRKYR